MVRINKKTAWIMIFVLLGWYIFTENMVFISQAFSLVYITLIFDNVNEEGKE